MFPLDSIEFAIKNAGYNRLGSDWQIPTLRDTDQHRIYLPVDGQAVIFLKNTELVVKKGFVYFIPAYNIAGSGSYCANSLTKYWFNFVARTPFDYDFFQGCPYEIKITEKQYQEAVVLIKHCIDYYKLLLNKKNSISSYLRFQGSLRLLLAPFCHDLDFREDCFMKFEKVLNYINKNFDKDISITMLAELMAIEPNYFSCIFKEYFGISPKKFIIRKRMEMAISLLSHTNEKINEIAMRVGFVDYQYFNRSFRERIGMTPGQFRKTFRNKK